MRRALILAGNDLLQTVKDRPALFWMLIMPIGFILIFGSLYGGTPRGQQIALTVSDADQSFLSRAFTEALGREGFEIGSLAPLPADSGAARPIRVLTIPLGFQDSLCVGKRVGLAYEARQDANPEASVVAEMHVQRAIIQTLAHLSEAMQTPAGGHPPLSSPTAALGSGTSPVPLAVDSVFAARFTGIATRPRHVSVAAETAGRGRPAPRGKQHSLPATIVLFMLVNTSIYGGVTLTVEKQERILARIASTPVTRTTILAGKLLGGVLIALAEGGLLILAGSLLGGYVGQSPLGLFLVMLCFALVCGSMALFWGAVLQRPEQTTVIAMTTALFLGAIGGCWWPLEIVPGWLQAVGHASPTAWAMDGLHALISFGSGIEAVFLPCAVLLAYAAVFFALGARLLRITA